MREILFRGKRITDDKWVYGSFCMDALEQKNGLCGVDGFIRLYDHIEGKMQMYEVDRETVCQYTGLTDKNGTKIFEGDIIRAKIESGNHEGFAWPNMPVDFQKGSFCLNDRNGYVFAVLGAFAPRVTFEVIGNIHDNPELLQGGE